MTRARGLIALFAVSLLALAPATAPAWEAATTHAGLTEQAALGSSLHERLIRDFGLERGLYEILAVPPHDARDLIALLARFNPSDGFQPDGRGRLSAIGWLVAGAAVADSPARHFVNHFYDPRRRRGLRGRDLGGLVERARLKLASLVSGGELPVAGRSALSWLTDASNPMNTTGFWGQYDRAVMARTPAERARHLAGALTAAGALLHVLEDMGSPSHVRDDLRAHADPLSELPGDRGSRFERLAALAYGRLGVPAPTTRPIAPKKLTDYLASQDGRGLADRTAAGFTSAYTLPADRIIEHDTLRLSAADLGLPAEVAGIEVARSGGRGAVRDARGVCLANYRVVDGRLTFSLDDDCALEQIAVLLPETAGYATSMLDSLFRGSLTLASSGSSITVSVGTVPLGKGTLLVLWDDARGVRSELQHIDVRGGGAGRTLGSVARAPAGAVRVVALYRGVDLAGEPLSATGTTALR
jgi:hypothetical protein